MARNPTEHYVFVGYASNPLNIMRMRNKSIIYISCVHKRISVQLYTHKIVRRILWVFYSMRSCASSSAVHGPGFVSEKNLV